MERPVPESEVRSAFGEAFGTTPESWSAEALSKDAVAGATKGLYRVSCDGRSLVMKVLTAAPRGHERWRSSTDPAHPYFWKREALVYGSATIAGLGDELRAPLTFGIFEQSDDEVALWLEDVRGTPATRWSIERYGLAARHLGRVQGRISRDGSLPTEPWWSRGWLREYLVRHTPVVVDPSLATSTAARSLPLEMFAETQRLWDERERFLAMLDRLPRTLCHLDTWTLNLFADETDSSIASNSGGATKPSKKASGNMLATSSPMAPKPAYNPERLVGCTRRAWNSNKTCCAWGSSPLPLSSTCG